MNKTAFLLTLIILFSVTFLAAHPPSSVVATYDSDKQLVTVTFVHKVGDNVDHFIKEIVILKNKKPIITQKLSFQDSKIGGSLVFKVNDLKPKDKLNVTATCNKGGQKNYVLEFK
jgi:hypothetical protein